MKGAIFDLDGVITDTAKFHFEAWSQLAKEQFGLELPAEFEAQLKGISRTDSLVKILEFGDILDQYDEEQIAQLAEKKNGYYLKAIDTLTKDDILPGITDLIAQLKAHDVKLSIASASKNAPAILKKLGLYEKFDAIADPSKVANGKPAPDIFLAGAKAVDLDPRDCVGVEDAVSGVAAIKAANMTAVAVGDPKELSQADAVVNTTADFSYELFEKTWEKAK
ncbi:beta-phosphoglucomutase [Ligilactobacillus faecis]|uniref:Beta-phosphoglucomutase n=1 Tax=Ligilactobacillus faecis TaxID=762833 RepID=A0ABV4DTW2_9LACO